SLQNPSDKLSCRYRTAATGMRGLSLKVGMPSIRSVREESKTYRITSTIPECELICQNRLQRQEEKQKSRSILRIPFQNTEPIVPESSLRSTAISMPSHNGTQKWRSTMTSLAGTTCHTPVRGSFI